MPLAIRQRLKRNPSMLSLWGHILLRSFSLLVMGIILANAEGGSAALMHGLSSSLWGVIGLVGAILLWNVYTRVGRTTAIALKSLGAAMIVFDFAIYRRATPAGPAWLQFHYPEILGLIAFTYFATCLLYVPTRRWLWAPLVWFVLLVTYNAACILRWLPGQHASIWVWPFSNGCMASLVMAGVVASSIFLGQHRWSAPWQRIQLALLMAVLTFVAGWLLRPLGISKIRATPTWALWTIAADCALFTLLYWLCDMRKWTGWAWLFRPAGSNTLLTYLLPDLYYFVAWLAGFGWVLEHFNAGWPGIFRALGFTVGILLLSRLVTRAGLRMQL